MTPDLQKKSFLLPVALWLGAFVCALYPVNEWQLEFFMGAVILMFGWMAVMLLRDIRQGWHWPRSAVLIIAGIFWALVLCSAFWSEIKSVSFVAACFFSVMPLTFFGGIMAGDESYFKKLRWPLGFLFAGLSVWAIVQFFFLNAYFWGQARHPLADPSSLGALFSLAFFCALAWVVSDRPAKERGWATALAALLLCGIMATVARGPLVALVPGLFFFVVLLRSGIKKHFKSVLVIVLSGAAFFGLMQTDVKKDFDLGTRFTNTVAAENVGGNELRLQVWDSTLEMIKERPLLGYGIGMFPSYYPEHRRVTEKDGVYSAHNDPLQFWMELGVLGPLLFYAFVFACAVRTFRALKNLPQGSNDRIVIAGIFSALVAMVVHSHVTFNHYNLSILMMTGLLLSIWFHATGRALGEQKALIALPDNLPHNADKAMLVLPFLMTGWLFLGIMGGEHLANKARDALFRPDMDAFMNNINMADKVSMRLNFRAFLFAVNVPIAILEDRKSTLSVEQQKKLFEQVEWYMEDVRALNPRSATAYYYMAKVQTLVDPSVVPEDLAPPQELYEEALRLDPMYLSARLALLQLYTDQGMSLKERIAFMEQGYNFRYVTDQVSDYYGALSKLYLEDGNYGKVQEVLSLDATYRKRSKFSLHQQNMSIPQALMGGNDQLPAR